MQNLPDYTPEEICSIYRRQADRSRGVKILMQLTGWPKEKIEKILIDGGYDVNLKQGYKSIVQHDEALTLYKKGWTDSQIANYFGVHREAVRRWRRKHGYLASPDTSKTQASINLTISLYKQGMKPKDIAKKLGISKNCVYKRIQKWRSKCED